MCLLTHFACPRLLRKVGEYHVYSVPGERKRVCAVHMYNSTGDYVT